MNNLAKCILILIAVMLQACLTSSPIYHPPAKIGLSGADSAASPQALYDSAVYHVRLKQYEPAERLYTTLVTDYKKTHEAEKSAYMLGYLYTCSDNPRMNYAKAGELFESFLKNYPKSRYVSDSRSWITVIHKLKKFQSEQAICDSLRSENLRLNEEVRSLKQVLEELQKINKK